MDKFNELAKRYDYFYVGFDRKQAWACGMTGYKENPQGWDTRDEATGTTIEEAVNNLLNGNPQAEIGI